MLEINLAYFQPIRVEYSKSQSKSQKSQCKKINPSHSVNIDQLDNKQMSF